METVGVKGLMTYLKSSIRWYATGNTLSDLRLPMMSQQTRSSGSAARFDMVSCHHSTGSVLEVYPALPGIIRSTGTREYRWLMLWSWQLTDRFGVKSQRLDATT